MAVAYSTSGAISYTSNNAASSITLTPAMPAHAAGNMLVAFVGMKPDTGSSGSAPAGWTLVGAVSGGTGTTGIDTGPVRIAAYYKEATSSSETAPSFSLTGQNVSWAVVQVWTKASTAFWDITGTGGADTTTGTAFSAATASNPGLTAGDGLAVGVTSPTDAQTWSAQSVTATGMTTVTMTEVAEAATTNSQDLGGFHARGLVVTGTSTAAPTVVATAAGTTTNTAGVAYLVRLREIAPTVKSASDTSSVSIADSSSKAPITVMTNPAGTVLYNNLVNKANWNFIEDGSNVTELTPTGPTGEKILRNTLIDGQRNSGDSTSYERSDLQGPPIANGETRWMIWWERFIELPTTALDRWQIIGPSEIHGQTLSQATFMPEVGPDGRRRINANAGQSTTRYFDVAPIVIGEWHQYKLGIYYTQGSDGWFELWRDNTLVVSQTGATTSEPDSGYWKFANYRNASINGNSVIDVSGVKIYGPTPPNISTLTSDFSTGAGFDISNGEVSITGGTLNVAASGNYPSATSAQRYNLTNSAVYSKFVQPPNVGTGSTTAAMAMELDSNNYLSIRWFNNSLQFIYVLNGVENAQSVTYNATNHAWIQIESDGTNVYWETSPDGSTWTTQRTLATPFDTSNLLLRFQAGNYNSEANPGTAKWDNVNLGPNASKSASDTAALTITDSGSVSASGSNTPISASDTAALTITDASTSVITMTRADTASLTITDTSSSLSTLSRSDTAALTITDTSSVVAYPATASLVDDFTTLDTATKWTPFTGSSSQPSVVSGQLVISANNFDPNYAALYSKNLHSLAGSSISVELPQAAANQHSSVETIFGLRTSNGQNNASQNSLEFIVSNGSLLFRVRTAGSNNNTSVTYNATNHRFLRLTNSGANVLFETSPDGSTWTTQRTATPNFINLPMYVTLSAGYYTAATITTSAIFDNVNIIANQVVASDTASIAVTETTAIANALTAADTASLGVSDVSTTLVIVNTTDTSSISIGESPAGSTTSLSASDIASLAIADASASALSSTSTDTAALTITDTSSLQQLVALSASDTSALSIADASSSTSTLSRTDQSAVTITDASTALVIVSTTDTSSVSVGDNSSIYANVSITASDTSALTVTESSTYTNYFATSDTSSISIFETRAIANSFASADTSAATITETSAIYSAPTASDTSAITITETSSIQALVLASASDTSSVSITETSSVLVIVSGTENPALTISDSSTSSLTSTAADTAALTISDASTPLVIVSRSDTAALTITDTSSNVAYLTPSASDTSAVSITETSYPALSTTTTDTAALTITDTSATTAIRSANDTAALNIAETSAPLVYVTATDTSSIAIGENTADFSSQSTSDTSSVSVTDTATLFVSVTTSDTSSISIAESNTFARFIAASDTSAITITEARATQNAFASSDSAALSTNDVATTTVFLPASDTAAVSIGDTSASNLTLNRTDTSVITIDDQGLAREIGKYRIKVYVSGAWALGVLKVYVDGEWITPKVKIRESGIWN